MSKKSDYICRNPNATTKEIKSDTTCPLFRTEEDTTEHIMVCQEENNTYNLFDGNEKDCKKIVAIYKNNKENREKLEQQKSTQGKDIQQKVKIIQWESQMN